LKIARVSQRARLRLLSLATLLSLASVAQAQNAPPKKNIIQRHPTASAAVAGMAAHHYAKKHGHGILHRHPVATGVAAAAITHHYAKKK
jgi:hypothetical protein